jgi:prepilin-type N-terminal cleavage/methylation domain-containing protein
LKVAGESSMTTSKTTRTGFSLAELLVAIAIIGVLMGLLLPAVQRIRVMAARQQSANNLRQFGLATHLYNDSRLRLPANLEKFNGFNVTAIFSLMPYMDLGDVATQASVSSTAYLESAYLAPKVFIAPLDVSLPGNVFQAANNYGYGQCNYAANHAVFANPGSTYKVGGDYNVNGAYKSSWDNGDRSLKDISDGTSNTLLFGERYARCDVGGSLWAYRDGTDPPVRPYYNTRMALFVANWASNNMTASPPQTQPPQMMPSADDDCNSWRLQSFSVEGCQVCMADGSVRNVSPTVSATTWYAICWPNDGLTPGNDW